MANDYKTSKEAFVSDHNGSTIMHINQISSVALSSIALHSALRSRLPKNKDINIITEYSLLVLPLLFSMTVFAHKPLVLDALLLLSTFLLLLIPRPQSYQSLPSSRVNSRPSSPNTQTAGPNGRNILKHYAIHVAPLPALTTYRSHMLLMTILAIIAVDFPVFPRDLVKCETFGVSLMDLGVGSFVFSQGIVSAIPLLKNPTHLSAPLVPKLTVAVWKILPLVFLGFIRVMLVKGSDYPEHVSEYGVHWNFFISLAALPPLEIILHPVLLQSPIISIGLGLTLIHQFILSNTALQSWTLNAPRTNIIAQNKEGIVSLPGYLAIHILGVLTGTLLLPPSPSDFRRVQKSLRHDSNTETIDSEGVQTSRPRQDAKTAIELCSYAVVWWSLLGISSLTGLGGGVSRRLANARYVLWVAAFNTSFITGYLALDVLFFPQPPARKLLLRPFPRALSLTQALQEGQRSGLSSEPRKPPTLLEAINLNGLLLFLLANVATGLINLAVRTMYASDLKAMVILSLYAFGICAVAWMTKEKKIWKL
ncbi:GWT1-domain-containing protein [Hysterangium stoloniferum]|nr:GWT1-domain-containing protein [Hysterangium stoloniferum]